MASNWASRAEGAAAAEAEAEAARACCGAATPPTARIPTATARAPKAVRDFIVFPPEKHRDAGRRPIRQEAARHRAASLLWIRIGRSRQRKRNDPGCCKCWR